MNVGDEFCAHCRFFVHGVTGFGWCHRYAPRPDFLPEGQLKERFPTAARWPAVTDDSFCGEWEARRG